jgi:hypothetical protein
MGVFAGSLLIVLGGLIVCGLILFANRDKS